MKKYVPGKVSGKKSEADSEYPSTYGSHKSMIDEDNSSKLEDDSLVICKDNDGFYVTQKFRLDNGLADPNRYLSREKRDIKLTAFNIENTVRRQN